ncbi:MAG: hypothetical protein J6Z49_04140, partial [Kiritimatiellae bacterium]|nr:hypothetical protein [Kiritimatiellia bacterium]
HVYNGTSYNDFQLALTSHTVVFNDAQHRVFKDERLVTTFNQTFTSTRPCYLFASCNSGSAAYFSTARIYWCEFVDSSTDEVLRRFVPVVDDNGRPAMFDEIGETLYYNLGSGDDLTAGPREGEEPMWYFVEYLEADGAQWIDTGHIATSNTHTEVGYKFTAETQTSLAMIGGSQSPKYYPVSLNSSNAKEERYCYAGNGTFATTYPALQHHETVFNDSGRNVFVDGRWKGAITANFGDSGPYTMLMFAARGSRGGVGWNSKSRIWHYEIYEGDTPYRAFLPAVALDGNGSYAPCMHDRMSETNHFNKGTGSFTVGRIISPEVPLKLAARGITPSNGLNVLPFTERPSYGTVFTVDEQYAGDFDVEVRADGVYTVAKGTGGNAANVITVTGDTAAQFPVDNMPTCASVVLSGTIRLTADCDWRGLGKIVAPSGVTIDLNGNDLQIAGFILLPSSALTITDTAAVGGKLYVTVDENDVLLNNGVHLTGSLRLVKKGAGTFIAQLPSQTYAGGTDIEEGVLRIGDKNLNHGYNNELGPVSSSVFVGAGATIDTLGETGQEFAYVISNGTLSASRPNANAFRQMCDTFTLAGNATMAGRDFALMVGGYVPSTIYMNGYTMTVNLEQGNPLSICNATFAGEGVLEGLSGWIKPYSHPCVGTNLTLRFPTETGGLWLDKNFTVSNFVSHSVNYHKGGDSTALTVLGTFTPAEGGRTAFPNTILADGSTLDLSQMDDIPTFRTTCSQVDGKTTHTRTISFADTATINVKLGTRKISHDVPIVGWTEPPSNLAGLTFKAVDRGRNYSISKRSDGLYLTCGLMIIVR